MYKFLISLIYIAVNYFTSSKKCIISDLENRGPEYKACKKDELDNIDKFDEIIGRMLKEAITFLKKHKMNIFNISAAEQSYIYYRGYKDCVKLLKIIGVI